MSPPCHHIPQFQGCPGTSKAIIPQEMTLTYNPWPLQPPTLLIQPCFSPVVGWGWRTHYQVSVITPSHMLTALIYGDWGTCVHSVGVEFCMSIWICSSFLTFSYFFFSMYFFQFPNLQPFLCGFLWTYSYFVVINQHRWQLDWKNIFKKNRARHEICGFFFQN